MANASEVITVSEQINTYLYEGETLDLIEEMDLTQVISNGEKVVRFKIKAQAIEDNAKLELIINNTKTIQNQLSDNMKILSFKLSGNEKIKKIEIKSIGAFIRIAKADLVSDQPQDDDLSINIAQFNY